MPGARPFELLPAIDLRGGRVVRLRRGDFGQETTYSDDPVDVAQQFVRAGARWIHVVDLDGARSGRPVQREAVAAILRSVGEGPRVEVAGGLRTVGAVAGVLEAGAARAVLGTAAIGDPAFAGSLIAVHGPGRICVAIDIRDEQAVGHGWSSGTQGVDPLEAIERLADAGVTTFEVTAIERDGLLEGPDFELYARLVALGRGAIIASAGIASLEDVHHLRAIGCAGVIVGRALYEGRLDLAEAIEQAAIG